jgi:hypothetical protein
MIPFVCEHHQFIVLDYLTRFIYLVTKGKIRKQESLSEEGLVEMKVIVDLVDRIPTVPLLRLPGALSCKGMLGR